jgi:hypothetical protein
MHTEDVPFVSIGNQRGKFVVSTFLITRVVIFWLALLGSQSCRPDPSHGLACGSLLPISPAGASPR